jgi:tetratricopeptide (TPR) repeat protein
MLITDINNAFLRAVSAQKQGNTKEAARIYEAIIQVHPRHADANHNLGIIYCLNMQFIEAAKLFEVALKINDEVVEYWISKAFALLRLSSFNDVWSTLYYGLSKFPENDKLLDLRKEFLSHPKRKITKENYNRLLLLYQNGKFETLKAELEDIRKSFPMCENSLNLLGSVNRKLADYEAAIKCYKKTLLINPFYADGAFNLANCYQNVGAYDKALMHYRNSKKLGKLSAEVYFNMGNCFDKIGDLTEAKLHYDKALSINNTDEHTLINLGNLYNKTYQATKAIDCFERALEGHPHNATLHNNLGSTFHKIGKVDTAIEHFKKALTINKNYLEAVINLGNAYKDIDQYSLAIKTYRDALLIKPNFGLAHRLIGNLTNYLSDRSHLSELEHFNRNPNIEKSRNCQCNLDFALFKAFNEIGEYERAIKHLIAGNFSRKEMLSYDFKKDERTFQEIRKLDMRLNEIKFQPLSTFKYKPIFIIGMPRSGTSLVEQILAAHSKISAGGELSLVGQLSRPLLSKLDFERHDLQNFRQIYFDRTAQFLHGKKFLTDKMPHNFLHLNLIKRVIPESKVIHVRRDARATCWSNFKQIFAADAFGYCYDYENISAYYNLYLELMEYWEEQYPNTIYNLSYDKLVENPYMEITNLINYLNLDLEEACYAPHENRRVVRTASQIQVKKKIYTGSNVEWRNYSPYLIGFFDKLREK